MNSEFHLILNYATEISTGLICFFIVTALHSILVSQTSFIANVKILSDLKAKKYSKVIKTHFFLFLLFGFFHFIAVGLWAFFLIIFNTIPTTIEALLFAGSCYTTLGYMGNELPVGWRLLALFIAISGLFSFSISTATIFSKTANFKLAWKMKHHTKIMNYLRKHNLDETDFHSL